MLKLVKLKLKVQAEKATNMQETTESPLAKEYREKFESIKGAGIIKKMKLLGTSFPKVRLKDGSDAPDEILRFVVAAYGNPEITAFDDNADATAELFAYDSFCDAISALSNSLDIENYPSIIPLLCRLGNCEQIKAVISRYASLRGVKGARVKEKDVEIETGEEGIELIRLKPEKWNRRANTVVAFLDKITVYGRIKKDDISVMQQMDGFTLAQIMEFIKIAQEANAVNVTTELLQYKQDKYPNFDPMAEFTLDM